MRILCQKYYKASAVLKIVFYLMLETQVIIVAKNA